MKALKIFKNASKVHGFSELQLFISKDNLDEIINELEELENLQNRSCKNCKYATLDSARYLPVHNCLVGCNNVDYDFYCNKWSSK